MKQTKKKRSPMPKLYIALLLLLFYLPILVVVIFSFNDSKLFQWSGFTFSWYEKLMQNGTIWQSFAISLQLALLSCAASAVLGTLGAVGMAGRQFKTKGLLENVALVPIMVPEIILGMAYLTVFTLFQIPFGMVTMVIAHTTFCVPYIFINVKARLTGLDPSIGEAALDLGASPRRMFLDITLPLILPAVASGTLLAFAMSMDDVVISFFTNGPNTNTLPLQIFSMMKMGVTPEINALCTVMLGTVFLIVALSRLFRVRRKRA